jgi:hypothetical protein
MNHFENIIYQFMKEKVFDPPEREKIDSIDRLIIFAKKNNLTTEQIRKKVIQELSSKVSRQKYIDRHEMEIKWQSS